MFRFVARSRVAGALAALIVGSVLAGGVGHALSRSKPGAVYYACVSNNDVVRSNTIRLGAPVLSCPQPTDKIKSWNARGPQGVPGPAASDLFRVTKSTDQDWNDGPFLSTYFVKVSFDTVDYNDGGAYDTTADRFVAPSDGYYSFGAQVMLNGSAGVSAELILAINGQLYSRLDKDSFVSSVDWMTLQGTAEVHLAAGDYVELWTFYGDSGSTMYIRGPAANDAFYGHRIGT